MAEAAPIGKTVRGGGQSTDLDRLRARAVWMYFVEGKTQSEIAQALGVNRIAIVRCLADARRRNEVRITIAARAPYARSQLTTDLPFGSSGIEFSVLATSPTIRW